MSNEKIRFGRYSSSIVFFLLKLQKLVHWRAMYFLTCIFLRAMSLLEKLWFLYYVKRKRSYWETLRCIRSNRFCPSTVETVYEFWTKNPEHEAFKGLEC